MVLAFAIISKLGVETTSFAALLASAGVAVGMALSGNLSNFAGGLIILVFETVQSGRLYRWSRSERYHKGNTDFFTPYFLLLTIE